MYLCMYLRKYICTNKEIIRLESFPTYINTFIYARILYHCCNFKFASV